LHYVITDIDKRIHQLHTFPFENYNSVLDTSPDSPFKKEVSCAMGDSLDQQLLGGMHVAFMPTISIVKEVSDTG
jgi:hypothetical protein